LVEFYEQREAAFRIIQVPSNMFDEAVRMTVSHGMDYLLWAPVTAESVPEPYRKLLVHQTDMTSTLENFHNGKLHVEVLGSQTKGQEYFREVVLRLGKSGKRVEFGAIKIMLDLLQAEVREKILRERQPFGRILTEAKVEFSSQPKEFFRINSDRFINRSLDLDSPQTLYGRRNTLVDAWDQPLAEIIEILPPA
jgi:chorismate-pyruvate lyase